MGQGGVVMIFGIPWWVYIMILLIFFSGYMAFRAILAEQRLEQQFIEKEGEKYIQRMEAERAQKQREKKKMIHR